MQDTDSSSTGSDQRGKTLREIAADIGIDKSTVFRYVKAEGIQPVASETLHKNGTQYYDATAEAAIKAHFVGKGTSNTTLHNTQSATLNATHATPEALHNDALQRTQHLAEVEQLRSDHAEQLERMQERFTGELTGLLDKLQARHDSELDRIRADHAAEVEQIRQQLQAKDRLIEQLQQQLAEERQHSREQSEKLAQLADQAQQLQLAQIAAQQAPALLDEQEQKKKPPFWRRLFGFGKEE